MRRSKSFGDAMADQGTCQKKVLEFCESTSVHGLKYVTEQQRPFGERALWLVAVLGALAAFLFLFWKSLERYQVSPVIVAMDKRQRAVWEIPFPAVTVCPATKMDAKLFNYTDVILRYISNTSRVSDEEEDLLADLSLQCDIELFFDTNGSTNSSIVDRIEKYSPKVEDTIGDSKLGRTLKYGAFKPLLTEEGICFSFNMLPGEMIFPNHSFHATRKYLNYKDVNVQWSIIDGYHPKADLDVYPYRGVGAGKDAGFRFTLHVDHIDYFCKQWNYGLKVQLHGVADFPYPDQHSFMVPLNSVMRVIVSPSEILADVSMRERYSAEQRQCYFPGERPLRFFLQYTQSNCKLECLANFTLSQCGCVPFYMPRDHNTLICNASNKGCTKDAAWTWQQLQTGLINSSKLTCACFQSCVHVHYNTQWSQIPINPAKTMELMGSTLTDSKRAIIIIYFKDSNYIPERRTELYTLFDVIANCGGLLGLCLGMSALSIVELFYWLLWRACWLSRPAKISPPTPKIMKPDLSFFQHY